MSFKAPRYRHGNFLPIRVRLKEALWRRMYRDLSLDETIHTMSFDVFDTLVTRPWYHPFDQFAAVAPRLRQHGLWSMSDLDWMSVRIESDREARKRAPTEEVSLKDIYTVLAERLGWSAHKT